MAAKSMTVGSTNINDNSNNVAFKVVGTQEVDTLYVGGNTNAVSGATNITVTYITNDAVHGWVLFASVAGGITNYYWANPNPVTYEPYNVVYAASNDISSINGNYQKLVCTNAAVTVYIDEPPTNQAAFYLLEVDKGTNSFAWGTWNLTTNGLGSFNTLVVTNSGISSFQLYHPCAGTNLSEKWIGYQLK